MRVVPDLLDEREFVHAVILKGPARYRWSSLRAVPSHKQWASAQADAASASTSIAAVGRMDMWWRASVADLRWCRPAAAITDRHAAGDFAPTWLATW